jgi:plasmid replication initiation protein
MLLLKTRKGTYFYVNYTKQGKNEKVPERRKRKVVEHNDLITSVAKMDKHL